METNIFFTKRFQQELGPLIKMAEKLNCIRTFLVGFGEYVNFYQQRHAVFKTVRQKAPKGTVEGGEDITGDEVIFLWFIYFSYLF